MQVFIGEISLVLFIFSLFSAVISIAFNDGLVFLWSFISFIMLFISVSEVLISNNSAISSRAIFNLLIVFIFLVFAASIPMLLVSNFSVIDSIFNSVSSITTSGLLFGNISESILFWLSIIQWLSGLLFILFSVVVYASGINNSCYPYLNFQILSFENASLFEIAKSLSTLVLIYFVLTVCCVLSLILSGLPFFNALIYSFSSISTGGILDPSYPLNIMGAFSLSILSFFSILGAINFTLHGMVFFQIYNFFLSRKGLSRASYLLDPELSFGFVLLLIILGFGLFYNLHLPNLLFNGISAITTTGFSTGGSLGDYQSVVFVLVLALFIGGSALSTASGIKLSRARSLLLHAVNDVKLSNLPYYAEGDIKHYRTPITTDLNMNAYIFFTSFILLYVLLICLFSIFTSDIEIIDLFIVSAISISNAGNMLHLLGVKASYFGSSFKVIYILGMFLGRLEFVYPVILLFVRSKFFRNKL